MKCNNSTVAAEAHSDFVILQWDRGTLWCWFLVTSLCVLTNATKNISSCTILSSISVVHHTFCTLI